VPITECHAYVCVAVRGVGCIFTEMVSGTATFPGTKDAWDQLDRIWQVNTLTADCLAFSILPLPGQWRLSVRNVCDCDQHK